MFLQGLVHDLRYALRYVRKSPGFTLAAILTFALGIGVNTAIFSLAYAIVLKSLPVHNPGALIRYTFKRGDMDVGLSGPMYDAIRKDQAACTDVLAWGRSTPLLNENGTLHELHGGLASGNGFAVLGLQPALGRTFTPTDDVNGGGTGGYKAVLGHDFWVGHFQSDRSVIGRSITLNGASVSIIGVLPAGFQGVEAGQRDDIVLPLAFAAVLFPQKQPYRDAPGSFWLTVMGRLRSGETITGARANLSSIWPAVRRQADPSGLYLGGFFKSFAPNIESGRGGRSELRTLYTQPLVLIEILSGLLLLLCCVNIGLLMLARLSERRVEFALRAALGASGARVVLDVLLEIVCVAVPGLFVGMAAGSMLAQVLASMLGHIDAPPAVDVSASLPILFFSAGITVISALIAGLWPMVSMRKNAPAVDLKQSTYSLARQSTNSWIVSVQIAVSATLLVSAFLLGSTFAKLYFEPSGFEGDHLAFADVNLKPAKLTPGRAVESSRSLIASLQGAPGVQNSALMSMPPLRGWMSSTRLFSFDRHGSEHSDPEVWPESVSATYFDTVGTRILEGRALTAEDTKADRVCVLSRSAAQFFFPGEDAIGRVVYSATDASNHKPDAPNQENARRVVGIAEDAHFFSLRKQADRLMYTPMTDKDLEAGVFDVAVRASNLGLAADEIRHALNTAVPGSAPPTIYSYREVLNEHLQRERMLISLSTSFGVVALLLVAVGVFGVLMRSVAQRTREIGIRMALGEGRGSILKTVLMTAIKRVLVGVAIGTTLAIAASRLMRSLLFETSATDPWIYTAAAAVLIAVAGGAALLPAKRAVSIEPMRALRTE